MREKNFNSLAELRAEIDLLKVRTFEQGESIKAAFSRPLTIYQTVKGLFQSGKNQGALDTLSYMRQDVITALTRLVLPIFMNGFIFKKSNFLMKTLVLFLSQKVAKNVDSEGISDIVRNIKKFMSDKLPEFFDKINVFKKKKSAEPGIDRDSFV